MFKSAILFSVLFASLSAHANWKCVGTRHDGQELPAVALVAIGEPINGMSRVYQAQIGDVKFLAWEIGPFPQNAQSLNFMTMAYDLHNATPVAQWDARTKNVKQQFLETNTGVYTLSCY